MLSVGDVIDRYRIEAVLGSGGMATVYEAYDPRLRRRVALKLVNAEAEDRAGAAARLKREALAVAAFTHPHVVAIYDVGETREGPFIAMELVRGKTLAAFVGDRSVSLPRRLRWMIDAAKALDAAHVHHIVHRDVKPGNLMVARDGVLKVLDFGIARSLQQPTSGRWVPSSSRTERRVLPDVTQAGARIGTPRYMAPEQLRAETSDGRADQFAWGIVAYELLTGRHPWDEHDDPEEALRLRATSAPAPLRDFEPEISPRVGAAVLRALRFAPDDRFPSMDALLVELEPGLEGSLQGGSAMVVAEDATRPEPRLASAGMLDRVARRAALGTGVAAAVMLGVLGLRPASHVIGGGTAATGASSSRSTGTPPLDLRPSAVRRLTFDRACDEFPSFSPDGRTVVFDGSDGADTHVFVVAASGGAPRALTHGSGWDMAARISPQNDRVTYLHSAEVSATYVAPLDESAPPHLVAGGNVHPRWSADGAGVWGGSPRAIAEYDAATGAQLRTVEKPSDLAAAEVAEAVDGSLLVRFSQLKGARAAGIALFPAQGPMRWLLQQETDEVLTVTPDGRHVLTTRISPMGSSDLVDLPTDGSPATSLAYSGLSVRKGLAVSPDGKQVVWSTCEANSEVVVAAGEALSAILAREDPLAPEVLAAVPHTPWLLVLSKRGGSAVPWLVDRAGREPPHAIPVGALVANDLAVSSDGAHFAMATPQGIYVGAVGDAPGLRRVSDDASDAYLSFRAGDGEIIFSRRVQSASQVMVATVDGGPTRPLLPPGSCDATASPLDDRVVYFECSPAAIRMPQLWDGRVGKSRPLSPTLTRGSYSSPRWSSDARRVALLRDNAALVEVDVTSGKTLRVLTTPNASLYTPTYAGKELLAIRALWRGSLWSAEADLLAHE